MSLIRVLFSEAMTLPRRSWFERNPIIASFLLTSIVGSGITVFYQHMEQASLKEAEVLRLQRNAAREMLSPFSELAERRNYFAFRILGSLDDIAAGTNQALSKDLLKADREKYRSAVEEWNIKRNYYERFIALYLGEPSRAQFYSKGNDQSIVEGFVALHKLVISQLNIYDSGGATDHNALVKAKVIREQLTENLANIYDELIRYSAGVAPSNSTPPQASSGNAIMKQ